ncbi:CLUMA_CG011442, isoform A [Clunio marinus]|uniref:Apyrase n=1 Tax=Clunio marinus TaxID=568069 RepID=A0A1J1IHZ4_9DIPT|nr:CLUMA_CG011442, isoform A [Clunio marinus]
MRFFLQRVGPCSLFHEKIDIVKDKKGTTIAYGHFTMCMKAPKCDSKYYLGSPYIDMEHFVIYFDDGRWFIKDLDSETGTFLCQNNNPIQLKPNVSYEINFNDIIGIAVCPKLWNLTKAFRDNKDLFVYEFLKDGITKREKQVDSKESLQNVQLIISVANMMHKSSSFSGLLNGDGLQSRWRQTAATSFIRRKKKFRFHFIYLVAIILVILIIYVCLPPTKKTLAGSYIESSLSICSNPVNYNSTYPLTRPIVNPHNHHTIWRIGIIADLDTNSKRQEGKNSYSSFIKRGHLTVGPSHSTYEFKWDSDDSTEITSGYSLKGRGMELSELVTFNGKLLTFDDRTGIVFEINNEVVSPWVILTDGETISPKGFKSEWATVKNNQMFVGSMGKEWTNAAGVFENYNPMMVKVVSASGEVKTLNWIENFKALRSALSIEWPGYLIHESGAWSENNRKWFFLPRRCSMQRYNETLDESRGCNQLLIADETFKDVKAIEVGVLKPTRGFSSFKFLPGSMDSIIVALKTEELNGATSTFVTVFDINGNILLEDERIHTEFKYEGFEFI